MSLFHWRERIHNSGECALYLSLVLVRSLARGLPEACVCMWWQMDVPLDMGLDGFKCDGTDPYVMELVIARGYKGVISYRVRRGARR